MDAAALSELSRSELVAAARANDIDPKLTNEEIISALLLRFPLGFVPYTGHSRRSSLSKFVGRVKSAFKTIRRSSLVKSTLPPQPQSGQATSAASVQAVHDAESIPDDTWSTTGEAPHNFSPVMQSANVGFTSISELEVLDAEDVRRLIADMANISARNKSYLARAAAMKAEADRLTDLAKGMKHQLVVEQTRRQRAEDYFKYWRAMDPRWSYTAIWDSKVVVAPVVTRLPGIKGSLVMDLEVTESDDEALKKQWTQHHRYFKKRRRDARRRKAEERNVPLDIVSDVETASDEEEFYSPFALDTHGDQDEAELYVYPMMNGSMGNLFNRAEDILVLQHGSRKRALEDGECREEKRARREQVSVTIPGLQPGEPEKEHERRILAALGQDDGNTWSDLGPEGGWLVGERDV
ncbi:hypothetical protein C8F01DRAFT_1104826, partial [Mycena amicta]